MHCNYSVSKFADIILRPEKLIDAKMNHPTANSAKENC
jgi:hypothetical protein